MSKVKYEEIELNDEEYKEAVFQRDSLKVQEKIHEFNLNSYKEEVELRIPQRALEKRLKENLEKMEKELELLKSNLAVFERQVRTKKREVPIPYDNEDEEEISDSE